MESRYFIRFSFLGSAYHGWQRQENAVSVQEVLEKKLSTILGSMHETMGCGRTDTGVHAKDFYAHFSSSTEFDPKETVYRLNRILPVDIAVSEIKKVKPDAHARFDAISRSYEYIISKKKNPFMTSRAYYRSGSLDMDEMNACCGILKKYHDFAAFSKSNTQVKTNLCTIYDASWKEENELLIFRITANRFLRNMVRAIVGTMIEAGQKKLDVNGFEKVIESGNRSEAGLSVPACGLYLTGINYPKEIFIE